MVNKMKCNICNTKVSYERQMCSPCNIAYNRGYDKCREELVQNLMNFQLGTISHFSPSVKKNMIKDIILGIFDIKKYS